MKLPVGTTSVKTRTNLVVGAAVVSAALAFNSIAEANPFLLTDTYVGGHDHGYGDVIEDANTHAFEISNGVFQRLGNTLEVTITTNMQVFPERLLPTAPDTERYSSPQALICGIRPEPARAI